MEMRRRIAVAAASLALVIAACGGASPGASSLAPTAAGPAPSATATSGASAQATAAATTATTEATMAASPTPSARFTLTSAAFQPNGEIPRHFGCDGDGVSPPLAWAGVPDRTAELELLVDDPDAGGFVHWVAAGIPPTATSLAEDATGSPAVPIEGRNSAGRTGWTPPCPPSGTHHYHFTLYAVSRPLGLTAGASADALRAAAKDTTVATAELVGTYHKG